MPQKLPSDLATAVDRMPAFPQSVQRVVELAQDERSTARDLVQVIDKDPVLTVKLLKLVNSAYFRLPRPVATVGHAVVFLGIHQTRNMALAMAALGMLPAKSERGFDWTEFLVHCLATAGIARQLAADVRGADPLESFVGGLLHDFGKVVIARARPEEFHQAVSRCRQEQSSLHLALRESIGIDHTLIAAALLERWRLSETLVLAVQHPQGDPAETGATAACVFAANQIAKKLRIGESGNPFVADLPAALVAILGGTLDALLGRLDNAATLDAEARQLARA